MTERLTKRNADGAYFDGTNGKCTMDRHGRTYGEAAEKLAYYEDLEEQGMLIKRQCKIGDILYYVVGGKIFEIEVSGFELGIKVKPNDADLCGFHEGNIGKVLFFTNEEAEAALKGDAE